VGHADRSAYDLQVHSKATKVDLNAIRRIEPPKERVYAKVAVRVRPARVRSNATISFFSIRKRRESE
jgi:glycyl-tRNA synthetase (class II)